MRGCRCLPVDAILQLVFLVEGVVAVFDSSSDHPMAAPISLLASGTTSVTVLVGLRMLNNRLRPASYLLAFELLPVALA